MSRCIGVLLVVCLCCFSSYASADEYRQFHLDFRSYSSGVTAYVGEHFYYNESGAACINGEYEEQSAGFLAFDIRVYGSEYNDTLEFVASTTCISCWDSDTSEWRLVCGFEDDEVDTVRMYGFGGDDTIVGLDVSLYSNYQMLFGGSGADEITGCDAADIVDYIYGGSENDTIFGMGGNDRLYGQDGADEIYGGVGHDRIYGNAGDDSLYGDDNCDEIYGADGVDTIELGDSTGDGCGGAQEAFGGADTDYIYGSATADLLVGGSGDDIINGYGGENLILGGGGADFMIGGDDPDCIFGYYDFDIRPYESGVDGPFESDTNDFLSGQGANDRLCDLSAGSDDYFIGGEGFDIHLVSSGDDYVDSTTSNSNACNICPAWATE